jgi:two-component system, cell cycle sensor histidine kinase and response regulator CckA
VESMSEQGGVVAIRTGSRECEDLDLARLTGSSDLRPGTFVFCEVRDSGCGMDEETAARLFEPFYTTKFVGRGIGLFASQGIIQKHGGGFSVDTQPGQGSTITFLLPARLMAPVGSAPRSLRRAAVGERSDLGGKTVLVVDDQREVRAVVESFLRRLGCRVLVASNGFDAVRIFGQRHAEIDLVLLDLTMDGMDGVAAGRRMRTIVPSVPLVLTSGFNEAVVREKGTSLDPFGILGKPYRKNALREILEQMIKA